VKWARAVLGAVPGESSEALDALDKSGLVATDLAKYSGSGLGEKLGLYLYSKSEMEMIVDAIRYIHDCTLIDRTHRCLTFFEIWRFRLSGQPGSYSYERLD